MGRRRGGLRTGRSRIEAGGRALKVEVALRVRLLLEVWLLRMAALYPKVTFVLSSIGQNGKKMSSVRSESASPKVPAEQRLGNSSDAIEYSTQDYRS